MSVAGVPLHIHELTLTVFLQAEMVHADIDSAIGDNRHGKKMRLQTLK